jgi:hypothetical protein
MNRYSRFSLERRRCVRKARPAAPAFPASNAWQVWYCLGDSLRDLVRRQPPCSRPSLHLPSWRTPALRSAVTRCPARRDMARTTTDSGGRKTRPTSPRMAERIAARDRRRARAPRGRFAADVAPHLLWRTVRDCGCVLVGRNPRQHHQRHVRDAGRFLLVSLPTTHYFRFNFLLGLNALPVTCFSTAHT